MNRVPVARLGPIFSQDGATLTKKLFKCLPGPFPPVWGPKIYTNIKNGVYIGVRGSPEPDISSLRALGPGDRQVLRVVRAACALFDVFEEE